MQAKPNKPPPGHVRMGAGVDYTRLDILADLIGTTEKGVRTLLGIFELPIVHFPGTSDSSYVLTYAFESAMFALGMPKKIKESVDLLRVHQELAGVLYGTLTKAALQERVKIMIRELTSGGQEATIGRKRKGKKKQKRPMSAYKTWPGRTPT